MDVLALPILGLLIVGFMIYIWKGWLKNKDDRALTIKEEDEDDDFPSSPMRP